MADEENIEQEQVDLAVPEMWALAKPPVQDAGDDDEDQARKVTAPGAKVGKLIKLLNDIEEQEELETKVQELDPATGQSLLLWATLQGKFVLVEWLVKKCKRSAFAFSPGKELTIYDKWVEIRKEIEEKEREKAENPPEEEEAADDEEKPPEPTADQLVYEALSEFHEEWGTTGQGFVKSVGELGFYQGARDQNYNKNGLGRTLFPNGDMYAGEYKFNQREGLGTYFWADKGILYTGKWKNNLRSGIGRIVYPDGGRYYGAWNNDQKNGEGRYTYPDGSSYTGAWENDVKHGFGTYTFTDGSSFVGSFFDGQFVSGEWRLCGSTRYYGTFRNDVPDGAGVFTFKYGQEGSYRQEGRYVDGKWVPGSVTTVTDVPTVQIVIQQKPLSLAFSMECGGLQMEHLTQVVNFEPFAQWVRDMNANAATMQVQSVSVIGVTFASDQSIDEVRLKASINGENGKRLKGTDLIILTKPTTRLMVVLVGLGKTLVLTETAVSGARGGTATIVRLPRVRITKGGNIAGPFVEAVKRSDLRLNLSAANTTPLLTARHANAAYSNAEENVLIYIQHLHADFISTVADRMAAMQGFPNATVSYEALRISEIPQLSADALTVCAAVHAARLMAADKLPRATVEDQRPPTPIPPAPEARPDIEPLLAEQKKNEARNAAPADDE